MMQGSKFTDLTNGDDLGWETGTGFPFTEPLEAPAHKYHIVAAGTPIHMTDGQVLQVYEHSAVGLGPITFCTEGWLKSVEHNRAMDARPWWRKLLQLPPKEKE